MPCYSPMAAEPVHKWVDGVCVPGRPRFVPAGVSATLQLPCGKCLGCRQQRATEWAHRCEHEASGNSYNCFLTLTYRDEAVPGDGSLRPRDLRLFVKRLRKAHGSSWGPVLREAGPLLFFACGEYGDVTCRPHYHVALFNCWFLDAYRVGRELYESPWLTRCWPYGAHRLGVFKAGAAGYIAKYALKSSASVVSSDGVVLVRPFARMSRRPLIGGHWLSRYSADLLLGYLAGAGGSRSSVPRAYRRKMSVEVAAALKLRLDAFREQSSDQLDPVRLEAAALIHELKFLSQRRVAL